MKIEELIEKVIRGERVLFHNRVRIAEYAKRLAAANKALRRMVRQDEEEAIITVAEAFKKAGMKDLTPDHIKQMAEKPLVCHRDGCLDRAVHTEVWCPQHLDKQILMNRVEEMFPEVRQWAEGHIASSAGNITVAEAVKDITTGTVTREAPGKCSRCDRDFSPGDNILIDEEGKEHCTRSDCFFADREPTDDPPECKRCSCLFRLDESHEPYDHGLCDPCASKELEEIQDVAKENEARYDKLRDSRMKYLKQVSELKRGVAYVALQKRIDELEAELLEYQNLRERMILDKETVRMEMQCALTESGKKIESLEAANKDRYAKLRTELEKLKLSIERNHKALKAAGVELEEKGEEIIVGLTFGGETFQINRCPEPNLRPGYGPVNEDPLIGPDLKPHAKMSREQLLVEVNRLEALPCKAACKQCGEVFRLSTEWWGRDFICEACLTKNA